MIDTIISIGAFAIGIWVIWYLAIFAYAFAAILVSLVIAHLDKIVIGIAAISAVSYVAISAAGGI